MPEYYKDDDGRPILCPPHDFQAGWDGKEEDGHGIMFCRFCGEVREYEVQRIAAPAEEMLQIGRDYGEPT